MIDDPRFTIPCQRVDLSIREHDRPLSTVPGISEGIVFTEDDGPGIAIRCAVCLRNATGRNFGSVVIIGGWHFPKDTEPGQRWPRPGATPYRRCPECRTARMHPDTD